MLRRLKRNPWLAFTVGLTTGLLVGVGMLIGALASRWANGPTAQLPPLFLNASATHGANTMAIATGPIDEGVEGLFILDFLTGDLQCLVMNPRNGALGGLYKHNVIADLGVEQGKQPKYLMVTGNAEFRYTGGGAIRPAQSVVYIADANTGHWAAYMLPWNRQAATYNFGQFNPMIPLGKGNARRVQLE